MSNSERLLLARRKTPGGGNKWEMGERHLPWTRVLVHALRLRTDSRTIPSTATPGRKGGRSLPPLPGLKLRSSNRT
jgi:hypothetical protein